MGHSTTDDSDSSESDTETNTTDDDDRRQRRGGGRYPAGMPPPGMMYPPHMHHHHHHHHMHHMHHNPYEQMSPNPVSDTDASATEMAARERARTLLLEFREAKASLTASQKAFETSQGENERLNQVLYQQRMLFSKERTEFQQQRDQWERERAAMASNVPEATQQHLDDMASSVIEANRDKVAVGEELRVSADKLSSLEKEYKDLERLYLMQESEIQVLREALESEKEKAGANMNEVESKYVGKLKEVEEGTQRKLDLENSRVISELMRDNEELKRQAAAAREDAMEAAAEAKALMSHAHYPATPTRMVPRSPQAMPSVDPMNLDLINRLSSEVGALRQQLSAAQNNPNENIETQITNAQLTRDKAALAGENRSLRLELHQLKLSSLEQSAESQEDVSERHVLLEELRRLRSEIHQKDRNSSGAQAWRHHDDKDFIRKQINELRREIEDSHTNTLEGGRTERELMSLEVTRLREEVARSQKVQTAMLQDDRDKSLALLMTEVRALKDENGELRRQRGLEKDATERDTTAILDEMRTLRRDLHAAKGASEEHHSQLKAGEVAALRQEHQQREANLQADVERLEGELAASQEGRRQLQSAAAAARLHRQADTNVLKEADRLRTQLAASEAKLQDAESSCAVASRQLQREEKRHLATRQRLESIVKEHDSVLSVLEKAKDEKQDLKTSARKAKKAADDAKTDTDGFVAENHALKQQLEYMKGKLKEAEQLRIEVERQRDGLGVAVRQASDNNYLASKKLEQQEEVLSHERLQLHSAMRQQEAEFVRQREILETELLRKDATRGAIDPSEHLMRERYEDLERKVSLLMHQQHREQATPGPGTPRQSRHQAESPEQDVRSEQYTLPPQPSRQEATKVRHLTEQLSTKDRELEGLRSEMDELRRLVEAGMMSNPPSLGSRQGAQSMASGPVFRPGSSVHIGGVTPNVAATPTRQSPASNLSRATPKSAARPFPPPSNIPSTRSGPL